MSHRLSDKAIACLVIASQPVTSVQWASAMTAAEYHFGAKVIDKKFEELARKGYIEVGVSARTGWLTTKGKQALQMENQP